MAQTQEEREQNRADRQAEKAARQQLRAEEKAAKQQAKADTRAEKDQLVNLRSAQRAEIMAYENALEDSGLSKKEIRSLIKDERSANREEFAAAKETLSADGVQYIGISGTRPDGTQYRGPIVSTMSTIGEEYRRPIVDDLRGALSYYRDYNLPGLSARGDARIGFGLDDIVKLEYSRDPETGEYGKTGNLAKTIGRAQEYVKNTFTAEELAEQGVKIKQDKTNPDLYTWKFGSDEQKGYIFFKDNGDGTFTGIGANRLNVDTDRNFLEQAFVDIPYLPEMAAIGASFIPGAQPFVGEIYAAGKGLQTASLGGDFDDALKAAGLAYLGSNVLPGVVGNILPADLAAIPGVTQGVTRATMGALSGQELDDALMSGLIQGAGTYTGSQISNLTGSKDLGRVGGALTRVALSGGDVNQGLQNALLSGAVQYGMENLMPNVASSITDPTARRIAENSLGNIISKGSFGDLRNLNFATPIPGIVNRQFNTSGATRQSGMARGGRVNPPLRRNVNELIPLRKGALSMMRNYS